MLSFCSDPLFSISSVKLDALLFRMIRSTLSWCQVPVVSHPSGLVLCPLSLSLSLSSTDAIRVLCCSSLFSPFASPLSSSYRHLGCSGSFVHNHKTTQGIANIPSNIKLEKSRLSLSFPQTISLGIQPRTSSNLAPNI